MVLALTKAIGFGLGVLVALALTTYRYYVRLQSRLDVAFPTPAESSPQADDPGA